MSNEVDIVPDAIKWLRKNSSIPNRIIATGAFFNHLLCVNKYNDKKVYQWVGKNER